MLIHSAFIRKRLQFGIAIWLGAVWLVAQPDVSPQTPPRAIEEQESQLSFLMGSFVVNVHLGAELPTEIWSQIQQGLASGTPPRTVSGLTGRGSIRVHSFTIPVHFTGIQVKLNPARHVYVATAGVVLGDRGPSPVRYNLGAYAISLRRESIRIRPTSAVARVEAILTQASCFKEGTDPRLRFVSENCRLDPDGSIAAQNFRGEGEFTMRESVYTVRVDAKPAALSLKGSLGPVDEVAAKFSVTVLREREHLFNGNCRFSSNGNDATFDFQLVKDLTNVRLQPERDFFLTLKSGYAHYTYTSGVPALKKCSGRFVAHLDLPRKVLDKSSNAFGFDLTLGTDASGALLGPTALTRSLRAGFKGTYYMEADPQIVFEAREPDSAYVYFPRWGRSAQSEWAFPDKILDDCLAPADQLLPGVVIRKGTMYFSSRQITCDGGTSPNEVKTAFSGRLNLTPWGISGQVDSGGNSFIQSRGTSSDQDQVEYVRPNLSRKYSFGEIVAKGDEHPEQPQPRFKLAMLNILEMRLWNLELCMNEPRKFQTLFTVHFPWPAYCDMVFLGEIKLKSWQFAPGKIGYYRFASAMGPVTSRIVDTSVPVPISDPTKPLQTPPTSSRFKALLPTSLIPDTSGLIDVRPPPDLRGPVRWNPQSDVLWAWRLPVTFAPYGVLINFPENPQVAATASIDMTSAAGNQGISSSELGVGSLFSKQSAIHSGVRFAGSLTAAGDFKLFDWDRHPVLGLRYAPPGEELKTGFEVRLNGPNEAKPGIWLTDRLDSPFEREADFGWNAIVSMPYFAPRSQKDWIPCSFAVRNQEPKLKAPTGLHARRKLDGSYCSDPSSINIGGTSVNVPSLIFDFSSNCFRSDQARFTDASGQTLDGQLRMTSYCDATFKRTSIVPTEIVIIPERPSPAACNNHRTVKTSLRNAVPGSAIEDLVCDDSEAKVLRTQLLGQSRCLRDYVSGDYVVASMDQAQERILLRIPNVRYYRSQTDPSNPQAGTIEVNNSTMDLNTDQLQDSKATLLRIPGAILEMTPFGLKGAFGATVASQAAQSPYEGEFKFLIDANCGYYYFLGAGAFTYGARFTGQLFIVHAPYAYLKGDPGATGSFSLMNSTPILDDIATRALFIDTATFEHTVGLDSRMNDASTIVSGVMTVGGAGIMLPCGIFANASTGNFFLQYRTPPEAGRPQGTDTWLVGGFLNGEASADFYAVSVKGALNLGGSCTLPETPACSFGGSIALEGCIGISPFKTCLEVRCDAELDSRGGISIGKPHFQ